ncbi:MAG: TonB family protein [Methylobacter sp.]
MTTRNGLGAAVMFIKILFPIPAFHFLESQPAPLLGRINHSETTRRTDRRWLALSIVFCAHLVVFAALLPQSQPLPLEVTPEPIMVSLLSMPQAVPQKPALPATPVQQQPKPIKKPVKTAVSKPVIPAIKPTSLPVAQPVQQASAPAAPTSPPAAEPVAKATNSKPADTQSYQSPNFNAAYLNNPAPAYPSVSRRLGEQGLVLLRVQVTADGTADSVELETGSGSSRLDQAALEAVKKWQFVPAKRGDQSISASVVVPVRFSIEG